MLVTVESKAYVPVYQVPALSPASLRSFQPGPGEAHPVQSVSLHFEGVIFVEGHLLRLVSEPPVLRIGLKHHLSLAKAYLQDGVIYSSRLGTLVQCRESHGPTQKKPPVFRGIMTLGVWTTITSLGWIVPMVWMTGSPRYCHSDDGICLVAVTKIMQPKANIETWITSEGNAYFVQLQDENDGDRGSGFPGDDFMVGSRHSRLLVWG